MKKNCIEFMNGGKEFIIKFADGAESLAIESKKEGFEAITKLAQEKKITVDEFSVMRDQILHADNLPWDKKSISIGIVVDSLSLEFLLLSSFIDFLESQTEPPEIAYLKMCDRCDENHGRIYTKTCYSSDFETKEIALIYLDKLKKEGYVDDSEFAKVKSEIEKSALA
jgi:hypothetical protein